MLIIISKYDNTLNSKSTVAQKEKPTKHKSHLTGHVAHLVGCIIQKISWETHVRFI